MTFSIIAHCKESGQFGIAISSSSPAVGARCAHVRAGVGAVASQNITDPALGHLTLDAMESGLSATEAIAGVLRDRAHIAFRQLLAVDRSGASAIHSGSEVLGLWGEALGECCAAAGNLLASPEIPRIMVTCLENTTGPLADRLMASLEAALAAGGEAGPVRSAALKLSGKLFWPLVDLRVDWSETPIEDLRKAWVVYQPQMDAYVQRALDPSIAPSFGVPGNP